MIKFNKKSDSNEIKDFYESEGYVVFSGLLNDFEINGLVEEINSLLTSLSDAEVKFFGMVTKSGEQIEIKQRDFLMLPEEDKLAMISGNWRIHEFHKQSRFCKGITLNSEIIRIVRSISNDSMEPGYSINFRNGSNQMLHQDDVVFHIAPLGNLVGAWIALEDIVKSSGPLVFYPKSHKEPLFDGFAGYPTINLRTCDDETFNKYQPYVDDLAEKYDRKVFLANKGDVLFWHGGLIHGGSKVEDTSRTRRSLVIHYCPPKLDIFDQIKLPVRWGK